MQMQKDKIKEFIAPYTDYDLKADTKFKVA